MPKTVINAATIPEVQYNVNSIRLMKLTSWVETLVFANMTGYEIEFHTIVPHSAHHQHPDYQFITTDSVRRPLHLLRVQFEDLSDNKIEDELDVVVCAASPDKDFDAIENALRPFIEECQKLREAEVMEEQEKAEAWTKAKETFSARELALLGLKA